MQPKFSKGPWSCCGQERNGCSCGQVWSRPQDHPVAEVTSGAWGDAWPSVRFVEGSAGKPKAEAYMERMDYGEVPSEEARANAFLIAAAPSMYNELEEVLSTLNPDCAGAIRIKVLLCLARGETTKEDK